MLCFCSINVDKTTSNLIVKRITKQKIYSRIKHWLTRIKVKYRLKCHILKFSAVSLLLIATNIINLKFTRQNVMQFVKSSLAKMRFVAYTINLLIQLALILLLLHKSSTISYNIHFNLLVNRLNKKHVFIQVVLQLHWLLPADFPLDFFFKFWFKLKLDYFAISLIIFMSIILYCLHNDNLRKSNTSGEWFSLNKIFFGSEHI